MQKPLGFDVREIHFSQIQPHLTAMLEQDWPLF